MNNLRGQPGAKLKGGDVSHRGQNDFHAAEADHAEKVRDVIFVARDQSPDPLQPGKQPFDTPSSLVSSQLAPALGLTAVLPVGRDQQLSSFSLCCSPELAHSAGDLVCRDAAKAQDEPLARRLAQIGRRERPE